LLTEDEKRLFTRLGVFSGGWTLEAAEEVANPALDLDVLDVMTSLLEKSLIKHEENSGEPRFSMLRTIAECAAERLEGSEDIAATRQAHAEFYLLLIAASHQGLRSASQVAWMARLESDNENLRVAMRWYLDNGRADEVADAGWTIWLFWWINAHLQEGRDLMKEVLDAGSLSQPARAKALAAYGVMAFWQTDYAVGLPALMEALELMRANGDMAGVALCQLPLGFVDASAGNGPQAEERYLESIKYFKETGDEWGTAIALNAYTWMSLAADMDIGEGPFQDGVDLSKRLGTHFEYGMALRNLGGYRARRGDTESAKEILGEALRTLWHGSARGGSSYTVDAIGELAADSGAAGTAAQLFGSTFAIREAIGSAIIPMFRARFESYVERVREDLGEERFSKEWAEGEGLGMDQTVELALTWLEESSSRVARS
jgi:tetratricopeptide (TPR) repeat protein